MYPIYRAARRLLLFAPLLLAGAGCTLYQSVLPATPLIQRQGQWEASVGLRPLAGEGTVAYSPAKHLQVAAAGYLMRNGSAADSAASFTRSQQGELGVGYYADNQKQNWHFSTLAGVGRGGGRIYGTPDFGVIIPSGFPSAAPGQRPGKPDRRGVYQKYYGQVGVSHVAIASGRSRLVTGGVLRATWVSFTRLTRNEQPLGKPAAVYLEPMWFWRYGSSWVQGQAAVGFFLPTNRQSSAREYLLSNGGVLLGGGLVFVPSQMGSRKARRAAP